MGRTLDERRRATRFEAPLLEGFRATLRPGNTVQLVNLGTGGALVHSRRALRPGSLVHLQLTGGARIVQISAQITRCAVAALSASDGVTYAGALQFEPPCDLPWPERVVAAADD